MLFLFFFYICFESVKINTVANFSNKIIDSNMRSDHMSYVSDVLEDLKKKIQN